MKAFLAAAAAAVLAVLIVSSATSADTPTGGGGLTRVQHDTSMAGSGTTTNLLGIRKDCSTNEILKWNGSAWACSAASGGVSNVSTVAPLQGGPITSTGSISLISCATNEVYKWNGSAFACSSVVTAQSCSAGQHISATTSAGVYTCSADAGGVSGSGTSGKPTRWTSSSAIGDASGFDDGTTYTTQQLAGTVISPSSISGVVNDWNPTGLSTATVIRITTSGTTALNGIVAPTSARILIIHNLSGNTFQLIDSAAGSTAANRFNLPGYSPLTLAIDQLAVLLYDTTAARWKVAAYPALHTLAGASCSAGNFVSALSSIGTGTCTAETGDISGVTANSPLSGGGTTGAVTVGMANGDRGDVSLTTGTQAGDTWTIDAQAVSYSKIQNVSATNRFLGRVTAGAGTIEELTGTQATSLLTNFTSGAQGVVSASGGGTVNFARADGTWAAAHTAQSCSAGQHLATASNVGVYTCTADAGAPSLVTVASLTADAHNWAPSGFSAATTVINITGSTAAYFITGISSTGSTAGRKIIILNFGGNNVVIAHNSGSSSAGNKIYTANGVNRTLGNLGAIELTWDGAEWFQTSLESSRYMPELYSLGGITAAGAGDIMGQFASYTDSFFNFNNTGTSKFTGNVYSVAQSPGIGKPVVSSCGTSPGIYGGSSGFNVTPGSGSPTSCTVTFATAFLDTPSCVITRIGGTTQQWFQWSSLSNTAGTFQGCNSTACGGNTLTNTYSIHCHGASINSASP